MRSLYAIYFARGLTSGLIKIGRTGCLAGRIRDLSRQWEPMELIAALPGPASLETEMHRKFAASFAPGRGREWFHDDGAIMAFVASLPAERRGSVVFRVENPRPHTRGGRPQRSRVEMRAFYAEKRRAYEAEHGHPFDLKAHPDCTLCERKIAASRRWYATHPPRPRASQPDAPVLHPFRLAAGVA